MFKKLFLIILLLCFKYSAHSQDISIKDIISLRSKTLIDVELYMKEHHWIILQSLKPVVETSNSNRSITTEQGHTTFLKLKNNKATASSLTFIYTGENTKENIILIGFPNKNKFLKYKRNIVKKNRKLASYFEENGDFIEIYEEEKLIYEFKTSLDEDKKEYYYLTIYDHDYFKGVSKYFDLEKMHFL